MYADQTLNLFLNFPFRIYLVLEISPSRSRRPKRAWTAPAAALGQDHLAGPYPQHFFDDPFLGTSIIISFKSHSIPILLLESLPPVIKLKIQPTVKAIYYTYIYMYPFLFNSQVVSPKSARSTSPRVKFLPLRPPAFVPLLQHPCEAA